MTSTRRHPYAWLVSYRVVGWCGGDGETVARLARRASWWASGQGTKSVGTKGCRVQISSEGTRSTTTLWRIRGPDGGTAAHMATQPARRLASGTPVSICLPGLLRWPSCAYRSPLRARAAPSCPGRRRLARREQRARRHHVRASSWAGPRPIQSRGTAKNCVLAQVPLIGIRPTFLRSDCRYFTFRDHAN